MQSPGEPSELSPVEGGISNVPQEKSLITVCGRQKGNRYTGYRCLSPDPAKAAFKLPPWSPGSRRSILKQGRDTGKTENHSGKIQKEAMMALDPHPCISHLPVDSKNQGAQRCRGEFPRFLHRDCLLPWQPFTHPVICTQGPGSKTGQ